MNIEATDATPAFFFDEVQKQFYITGESYPENVIDVYQPIIEWLNDYFKSHNKLKLIFDLLYFNTSSSKAILDILEILEEAKEEGKNIEVVWRYKSSLEVMKENGEDFMEEIQVPFTLEAYD